jgi:TusA-related sulfurtransferase
MDAQIELDTRGLNCPLPILKAKKALAGMSSGEVLKVVATDPGSMRDFQAFARQTGNELLEQSSANAEFVHFLRRRGRSAALPSVAAALGRRRAWGRPAPGPTYSSSERSQARKSGPSSGFASASSTLACRKPSLLPQS